MLKKAVLTTVLAAPVLVCNAQDLESRTAESRAVVKEFMQNLKGELQAAMKSGGPVEAIAVCNERAPAIAAEMSDKTQWQVGRTSLKLRNPDNAPDAWENKVLQDFELRLSKGGNPTKMEYAEVVETGDGKVFRYMKAIPTGEVCLACHGTSIAAPVKEKLQALYPEDEAIDYQVGDIRGAFTIIQPM